MSFPRPAMADMESQPPIAFDEKDLLQEVVQAGLRLLVHREHSRTELYRKLASRGYGHRLIEDALDQLERQDALNEGRFVEQYVAGRIRKGYGPVRIGQELAERSIDELLMGEWLYNRVDVDWYSLMEQACIRKFGIVHVDDYKAQAQRARFLEYRGFSNEMIRDLIWH